ncbi:S-formylglutathione hydrolase [Acuticoccus sp. I52.16.1]|uniref:S-formylglutathione hydrolase n=1 Tax=Acuticoccus sp. I52.16.1 TaxID=2928472 RepID=UPI001FD4D6EE|nr:S-formylglutathione hydrolase [Acuticoccus sp. I52.16.1]UOM35445.1 S-formylglutathione hydrolase [Acuticoccus sp. I52.16.1]
MTMDIVSRFAAHGGQQLVAKHTSRATGTEMTFAVYLPPQAEAGPRPVLWYLSGLTCTHANVMEKGEYRKAAAEAGIIVVCPDTSPRGEGVADDEAYDLGQGAGFYVDATQPPFSPHFKMRTYIEEELPEVVAANVPADLGRQGIFGHSMGGHGALTIALRHPERFASVSAFAPIVAPAQVPWGQKAFPAYLGGDTSRWRRHDAVALIEDGARVKDILVDQGEADNFLADQLKPELLAKACADAGIDLTLRMRPGYDHSYYFISTFMPDHIAWHAERLGV